MVGNGVVVAEAGNGVPVVVTVPNGVPENGVVAVVVAAVMGAVVVVVVGTAGVTIGVGVMGVTTAVMPVFGGPKLGTKALVDG